MAGKPKTADPVQDLDTQHVLQDNILVQKIANLQHVITDLQLIPRPTAAQQDTLRKCIDAETELGRQRILLGAAYANAVASALGVDDLMSQLAAISKKMQAVAQEEPNAAKVLGSTNNLIGLVPKAISVIKQFGSAPAQKAAAKS